MAPEKQKLIAEIKRIAAKHAHKTWSYYNRVDNVGSLIYNTSKEPVEYALAIFDDVILQDLSWITHQSLEEVKVQLHGLSKSLDEMLNYDAENYSGSEVLAVHQMLRENLEAALTACESQVVPILAYHKSFRQHAQNAPLREYTEEEDAGKYEAIRTIQNEARKYLNETNKSYYSDGGLSIRGVDDERITQAIEMLRDLLLALEKSHLSWLPYEKVKKVLNVTLNITSTLDEMVDKAEASEGSDDPPDSSMLFAMEEKIAELNELIGFVSEHDSLISRIALETWESKIESYTSELTRLKDEYGAAVGRINLSKSEVEKAVNAVNEAAGKTSVDAYARLYSELSKEHKKTTKRWLISASVSGGLLLLYGILLALGCLGSTPNKLDLQYISSKIIILTGLYYWIATSLKSYRAAKHNEVLYQHKSMALQTYQGFSLALETDKAAKTAVLTQAAASIFSAHSTGYVTASGESDGEPRIFEIVKSFTQKDN